MLMWGLESSSLIFAILWSTAVRFLKRGTYPLEKGGTGFEATYASNESASQMLRVCIMNKMYYVNDKVLVG